MAKLFRSPAAAEDLKSIWHFIANQSSSAADKHLQRLETKFELLAAMPELGGVSQDLGSGLRVFSVGEYVIIYQFDGEALTIVRVLHGARDFRALFPNP